MRLMRMPPSGALVTLKGNNFKSSCAKKKITVSTLASVHSTKPLWTDLWFSLVNKKI